MGTRSIWIASALALTAHGCKSVDCGDGTIERKGLCVPADESVGNAMCGPFTELQGDKCVPMFPPTECDPSTTSADVDPATGVTTCIGTGSPAGCSAAFACPAPATGKQTICGQIYDLENNLPFADAGATGAKCAAASATGPCALHITAYDALAFGTNPSTATPLATGGLYIDDCGRYRVTDITVPNGPFIGLGIDDVAGLGPAGVTNTSAIATLKNPGVAAKDVEAWIVKKSTTDLWAASGGPALATGYYAAVFRGHRTGFDTAAGVTITRSGSPIPASDFYFEAAQPSRQTIDPSAIATGVNGSVLINDALVSDGLVYSAGQGSLPAECRWESHAGATLPGIVFIQLFRPENAAGQTCPL